MRNKKLRMRNEEVKGRSKRVGDNLAKKKLGLYAQCKCI